MTKFHNIERGQSKLDALTANKAATDSRPDQHEPARENGPEHAGTEWPVIQPLLAKVESFPYPLDALPPMIREAVKEVQGFVKAPVALVTASALTALSLAIQSHVNVRRTEWLSGPVSLFMLTIADSGERKSTCDSFFLNGIRKYENEQADKAKPIFKAYQADLDAWEAKRGGVKDKLRQLAKDGKPTYVQEQLLRELEHDKPNRSAVPRLLYADATPEALAHKLVTNWPAAGVVSSEAGIVLGAQGMGKDSVMRNLSQMNILWDGGDLPIDRRSTESFIVKGARLTVGLQVQGATLRESIERTGALMRGTGFFSRFLLAWPTSTQGLRLFTEPPASWPALETFNQRIATLLNLAAPIGDNGTLNPTFIEFTHEAQKEWQDFHDAIEIELKSCGEFCDVRDVASKSADNVARLAALFRVFEQGIGPIGTEHLTPAIQVVSWHLNESRRFFGELAMPAELANAVRLERWLLAHCRQNQVNTVPTRTVQQNITGMPRDKAFIEKAAQVLEEHGIAKLVSDGKRRFIKINPALLARATATDATHATHEVSKSGSVATVAGVAVANSSCKEVA